MPRYRTPRGQFKPISGKHAATYPHPRVIEVDDVLYVEWVSGDGWGMTHHAVRWPRTPVGMFFQQYVEGRASGFPWWPVVAFSLVSAWQMLIRKQVEC
jgi:hypothetical protein